MQVKAPIAAIRMRDLYIEMLRFSSVRYHLASYPKSAAESPAGLAAEVRTGAAQERAHARAVMICALIFADTAPSPYAFLIASDAKAVAVSNAMASRVSISFRSGVP